MPRDDADQRIDQEDVAILETAVALLLLQIEAGSYSFDYEDCIRRRGLKVGWRAERGTVTVMLTTKEILCTCMIERNGKNGSRRILLPKVFRDSLRIGFIR